MEKWFIRSRSLWAAAIPLIVALVGFSGLDTTNLDQQLGELGTNVSLVVATVLVLRSRFKPDHAKLTAVPDVATKP